MLVGFGAPCGCPCGSTFAHFRVRFSLRFLSGFLDGLGEVPAPLAAPIPSRTGGGDSFQEIPLADLLEVLASNADGRRSLTRRIQIQIQFGIDAAGRPATPAQGCAGWARNPKGPQITPFRHQMGRRGTIWDFKTGIRLRIPARISPWGSRGPNPNFFFAYFGPKNGQMLIFWEGFEFIRDP